MRIAVDAMGGDYAPEEIVKGALQARRELGVEIALVGRPEAIQPFLPEALSGVTLIPAEEDIGMDEEPVSALKRKKKASILVAMKQLRKKECDAVVAAGNTGAAMAAAHLGLGRLPGIDRPAIGALLPTLKNKPVLLLDVGANVDCRPKFLEQFAVMGSIYSHYVLGMPTPQVGLANIGEEPNKGNESAITTHERLAVNAYINFAGNAEGRDILSGDFDVVVCDGFVGNILLKFAESVGHVITQIMKEELKRSWRGQLGGLILAPNLRQVKRRIDYVEYGGALLLGVAGVCVITHGSSKQSMVYHAIRLAKEAVEQDILNRLESQIRLINLNAETTTHPSKAYATSDPLYNSASSLAANPSTNLSTHGFNGSDSMNNAGSSSLNGPGTHNSGPRDESVRSVPSLDLDSLEGSQPC